MEKSHCSFLFILLACVAMTPGAAAVDPVCYNRDVLPILVDQCFGCHGSDSARRDCDWT